MRTAFSYPKPTLRELQGKTNRVETTVGVKKDKQEQKPNCTFRDQANKSNQ